MLSFKTPSVYQAAKCYVTYGTMGHPDLKQLPSKGKPWSSLLSHDFVHKVDLILPQELIQVVKDQVLQQQKQQQEEAHDDDKKPPTHQRVTMSLAQILEGDFFREYVKVGNVMMLSEGRTDADDVFSLKDGTLTMYLDKETYERAGLVGQPHGVKGKRGTKPRWMVQFDLRSPSMLHGKKAFDRLNYACKNVLNKPLVWLFCNLSSTTPEPDPLSQHFYTKYTSEPAYMQSSEVMMPSRLKPPTSVLEKDGRLDLDEYATDIYEWLSLLRLDSPRVNTSDNVDPYLSTYTVPGSSIREKEAKGTAMALGKLSWQGFMPPEWTRQLLAEVILAVPARSWFALSVTSFARGIVGDNAESTILRPPDSPGEYFLWDVRGHE